MHEVRHLVSLMQTLLERGWQLPQALHTAWQQVHACPMHLLLLLLPAAVLPCLLGCIFTRTESTLGRVQQEQETKNPSDMQHYGLLHPMLAKHGDGGRPWWFAKEAACQGSRGQTAIPSEPEVCCLPC